MIGELGDFFILACHLTPLLLTAPKQCTCAMLVSFRSYCFRFFHQLTRAKTKYEQLHSVKIGIIFDWTESFLYFLALAINKIEHSRTYAPPCTTCKALVSAAQLSGAQNFRASESAPKIFWARAQISAHFCAQDHTISDEIQLFYYIHSQYFFDFHTVLCFECISLK